ncbi:MAG TPA: hypothetical protein VNH22_05535 [Blastocatellia bacterium]|jgi:hypothetical protein|nr:hypothetical protein [Blastocatellia bacterium]
MLRSSSARWALYIFAIIVALGALRFKPWQLLSKDPANNTGVREELKVGFLPVT